MRRIFALALAVLVPATVHAQPAEPWESRVDVLRDDGVLEGNFERQPALGRLNLEQAWILPADMPADLRRRPVNFTSLLALSVDTTGRATTCRILRRGGDRRLDRLACTLLTTRARYPVRYSAPGTPVAGDWGVRVRWMTDRPALLAERHAKENPEIRPISMNRYWPDRPPGASALHRTWPRFSWFGELRPLAYPDVQAAYPAQPGTPAQATVSLDLLIDPARGITGCDVGVSSGNALLDTRACEVARQMRLRYLIPCDWCDPERLPLQVIWGPSGSHIRFPLIHHWRTEPEPPRDPADTRPVLRQQDRLIRRPEGPYMRRPADLSFSNAAPVFAWEVDATGLLHGCRAVRSSGNAALDAWICNRLTLYFSMLPETDAFGTARPQSGTLTLDLNREREEHWQ